ncbi:winged helix-turn-helix domain-containing protein [Acidobacteriota bacterium]
MNPDKLPQLDSVIHSRIRLAILSVLISVKDADFNYLKNTIGTTDGNLSTHLSKLEEKGYIKVTKGFKGKKPHTSCSLTDIGKKAFTRYLESLDELLHFKKEE